MSDLLPDAPKEKHIMDKVADFLAYKGMKRTGAKGLAANWFKLFGGSSLAAALRQAEVAPNVGNYAAYMAAIMKANAEPPEPVQPSQTEVPAREVTPIKPKRPSAELLYMERDRLVRQWSEANAERIAELTIDSKWYAVRQVENKAWLQAQRNLIDGANGGVDLTREEWQDAAERDR